MTFSDDLKAFTRKVEQRNKDIFVESSLEVQRSVVEGSELTGAPGQTVQQPGGGQLRGSYIPEFTGPWTWQTTTNLAYAESNEDGVARPGGGPYVQRSSVGGRWSVALTRAGWERIVEAVRKRVVPQ